MESNLSKPNPIESIKLWHLAQLGLAWCCPSRERTPRGMAFDGGGRFILVPGGGFGTFWQRNCSRINSPRAVGEVSTGLLVSVKRAAWPRIPDRGEGAGKLTGP